MFIDVHGKLRTCWGIDCTHWSPITFTGLVHNLKEIPSETATYRLIVLHSQTWASSLKMRRCPRRSQKWIGDSPGQCGPGKINQNKRFSNVWETSTKPKTSKKVLMIPEVQLEEIPANRGCMAVELSSPVAVVLDTFPPSDSDPGGHWSDICPFSLCSPVAVPQRIAGVGHEWSMIMNGFFDDFYLMD